MTINDDKEATRDAALSRRKRPIYTLPRHSEEYEQRRQEQYRSGAKTLLWSLLLFGGSIAIYFLLLKSD